MKFLQCKNLFRKSNSKVQFCDKNQQNKSNLKTNTKNVNFHNFLMWVVWVARECVGRVGAKMWARKCVCGCVGVAFECGGFEVVRQGLCVGKCVWWSNYRVFLGSLKFIQIIQHICHMKRHF